MAPAVPPPAKEASQAATKTAPVPDVTDASDLVMWDRHGLAVWIQLSFRGRESGGAVPVRRADPAGDLAASRPKTGDGHRGLSLGGACPLD
jgi:hypothetical protein